MGILTSIFGSYSAKELSRIEPIKNKVLALEEEYKALSNAELKEKTYEFRERLADGSDTLDTLLPEALATVREAGDRVLGKRAFEVQIIGAIVLHQGRIAEMKTGEGKTLVACPIGDPYLMTFSPFLIGFNATLCACGISSDNVIFSTTSPLENGRKTTATLSIGLMII